MRLNRIFSVWLRQFYLFRGNPTRVFSLFMWITLDIIIWGFIAKYLDTFGTFNLNFKFTFLSSIILWNFFIRIMHGVVMAFLEDVWTKNFINIFSSPISITEYILGLVLSSIITGSIGFIIMSFLAFLLFKLFIFSFGLILIFFIFILFLFGISLGIFSSAVVLKFGPSAEWLVWPLSSLLIPFACVFYPIHILPKYIRFISYAIPNFYVFESLRGFIFSKNISYNLIFIGFILDLFYLIFSYFIFLNIYKKAKRSGLILRYSAEILS